MMRWPLGAGLLALSVAVVTGSAAHAEGWGTIKGQVVWAGGKIPEPKKINPDKDKEKCEIKGPLLDEKLIIDKKTKGVKYAVVFLIDAEKWNKPLPINPKLAAVPKKALEFDQPCCMFIPRVAAVRQGQKVIFKNSASISHNVKVDGGTLGPNINPIIPAGKEAVIDSVAGRPKAIPLSCSIHGWMKGWLFSFKHPYFAITDKEGKFEIKDAPAGKYKLVIWHEEGGWVVDGKSPDIRKGGKVIDIPKGKTKDLGKFDMKLAD
jgi:hypothetical protein